MESWVERFVTTTQSDKVKESMCFASPSERLKFFTRLSGEIGKRGVVDVLRKGYKFNGNTFDLYYPLPSQLNPSAKAAYKQNIFGVIRQVRYSTQNTNEIDFVVFINGLVIKVASVDKEEHLINPAVITKQGRQFVTGQGLA